MDSSQNTTSANHHHINNNNNIINIYPINHYYFGSKDATLPIKHDTVSDRFHRLKSNYAQRGVVRINVEAVLLVELSKHPHLLLLQIANSVIKLPGGRLRPGESDVAGLHRKLSTKISDGDIDWKIGECLCTWWRSDFDTLFHRNLTTTQSSKECTKLFIVHLPEYQRFTVPKYQKFIAVPLRILHDNRKTYGPIISEIPQLLSKFKINTI